MLSINIAKIFRKFSIEKTEISALDFLSEGKSKIKLISIFKPLKWHVITFQLTN